MSFSLILTHPGGSHKDEFLACCLLITAYGFNATVASYKSGSMVIKTLVTPEWWALAVLPVRVTRMFPAFAA